MNGVQIPFQAKYFIMDIQLNCEHHIWCAVHKVSEQLSLMLQKDKKGQILLYFTSQNAVKYKQVFVPQFSSWAQLFLVTQNHTFSSVFCC